jgi:sugar O-acyltransferase (sialic acid O-acetyltransferase NeuD family)
MINYIKVPKDGASDQFVTITDLFFKNGDFVDQDKLIIEYETSKAAFEIFAEKAGYYYTFLNINNEIAVGENICFYSVEKINSADLNKIVEKNKKNKEISTVNITKKAKLLINKHNIDITSFSSELVTEKQVEKYLEKISVQKKINETKFNFKENDIVIMGIGGHAKMCIDIIKSNTNYNIVGYVDDFVDQNSVNGINYVGNINNLDYLISCGLKNMIIGIGFLGNLNKKEAFYQKFSSKINIPTIIHRSSIIEPTAIISEGCQIMAGAIIGSYVVVKPNCIINSGSIISHDSNIDESSHITPGAILAGHVKIGKRCTIGMGSSIYLGCEIPDDTIIKNNTAVNE